MPLADCSSPTAYRIVHIAYCLVSIAYYLAAETHSDKTCRCFRIATNRAASDAVETNKLPKAQHERLVKFETNHMHSHTIRTKSLAGDDPIYKTTMRIPLEIVRGDAAYIVNSSEKKSPMRHDFILFSQINKKQAREGKSFTPPWHREG